jgi:hypothetical protein
LTQSKNNSRKITEKRRYGDKLDGTTLSTVLLQIKVMGRGISASVTPRKNIPSEILFPSRGMLHKATALNIGHALTELQLTTLDRKAVSFFHFSLKQLLQFVHNL